MEDKQTICDHLLRTLQETTNLSDLVDLEYIRQQEQVVATVGASVKHIDVNGFSGYWFIRRVMDVLFGLEE